MIEDYLGIQIDYAKEENLSDFSLDTLKDRYFWKEEKYAQQALARASVYCATYQGVVDYDLAQRLYNYSSSHWFSYSTPILSNAGTSRGLPISWFLNDLTDSRSA